MTKPAVDLYRDPLTRWDGPLGLPDFPRFDDAEFGSVFDAALAAHQADIDAIAGNPETPTIENTFVAMELSGDPLDRVSSIFWCKAGANTNDQIQAMEREVAPKMSRHYSAMSMNEKLFARIDDLYRRRATLGLNPETLLLVEKSWKGFVKSGAKLMPTARSGSPPSTRSFPRSASPSARTCSPTRRNGSCSLARTISRDCPISSRAPWRAPPPSAVARATMP